MEAQAQQLQDALGPDIAVYLGSEWLSRQQGLPQVVVIPGDAEFTAPDGSVAGALASVQLGVTCVCKAATFEEAALLAQACYAALGLNTRATMRLRTELWGDYNVRIAALTITFPATLTRGDVTRVRVHTFTQLAEFGHPPPTEAPDDETRPDGSTVFVDHDQHAP